jgi:hypothetical protein
VAELLYRVTYSGPPTDLEAIASQLQVEAIQSAPLAMRGRIVVGSVGKVVVEVNEELPPLERRYVVAHELGHLILEGDRIANSVSMGRAVRKSGSWKYIQTEKFCDQAAAEMLLPTDWLLRHQPTTLVAALATANRAAMSIDVLAPRLVDIGVWKDDRLWWLSGEPPHHLLRSYPAWDEDFLDRVILGHRTAELIRECVSSNTSQLGEIDAQIFDESLAYASEAVHVGGNVVFARLLVGDKPPLQT